MKILTYCSFIVKTIYLFPQICELKSCFHKKEVVFTIIGAHYFIHNKEDSPYGGSLYRGNTV